MTENDQQSQIPQPVQPPHAVQPPHEMQPQQQPAPQYAQPSGQYAPPPAPQQTGAPVSPSRLNWLGIAALVAGILAFLLGWIPVLGIIVAVVGLGFGIFALVKKQPFGFALTGTILSAVAMITAIIVTIFFGAFIQAVSESSNSEILSSLDAPNEYSDQYGEFDEGNTADDETVSDAEHGSRAKPLALGTLISSEEWDITVNSVKLNATDAVLAAHSYNDAPDPGFQYALVNATVTYTGEDSNYPADIRFGFIAATGEVNESYETFATAPEPELGYDELYTGGTKTGNFVLMIPADSDGVLRVRPGILEDDFFVAVK